MSDILVSGQYKFCQTYSLGTTWQGTSPFQSNFIKENEQSDLLVYLDLSQLML